ncbi:MAG: alanine racemase [Clostridia bacterium]|nr:alanine racemase [Clostridia bacterium]
MSKRAWAEINLDAIAYNIRQIRKITSLNSKIMAVVKADAYGHGFLEVTKTLLNNGADCLGVAMLDEAVQLRKCGIDVPILILGSTEAEDADELVEFDVMPTVFTYDFAKALSRSAQKKNKTAKIHIKIDTGMSRIGYVAGENDEAVISEILEISRLENVNIDGIFSHFACSDEKDRSYTDMQFKTFMSICSELERRGLYIPIKHICNSAGVMMYPEMHLDMVRPGIILYGLYPSDEVDKSRLDLIPAMSLKARITLVKEVGKNRGVSYGKTYITDKQTKIATVPIGYADGYLRLLAKKAKMLVNGECVNVIGRICMDQCMIDVTNVNTIDIGDEATVFGADTITADSVAAWLDTINYEVVCMIGKRIPRVYIMDGKVVKKLNYLI